ncbi:LEA type 2 family protein [Tenacibaculum sp. AHE15PA]|uniref:NDR1/HIN1-like protein n=1 Tax=Tenacibaculum TaxID=104267 RepID=UPI001C4FCB21|nr:MULTISPECIES: LEA type 2 family protein [Tenacibaculum]QXP73778.1 LEA type 2 family protein [Tenacibaculum sp. AHE14PA]QXP75855.1 LEA type 2 family protein [Tenacibaculum sp. AHE15PA]
MKKLGFFIVVLFIVSCSIKEKPIFIKIDNIKILSISSDTIRLQAKAFFKNPNDIGGKIATDEIKVIVNGEEVAQVSSDEFEVPARNEFNIPLQVVIPAKKIFGDTKNGILGGLINSILNKSVKVQFKGDLRYTIFGFSDVYPIDKIEDIKIKF